MGILSKVRGLWRFDGDEEPITVSRRTFIFMGGVVAAGTMLPAGLVEYEVITGTTAGPGPLFVSQTAALQALFRETYRPLITSLYERDDTLFQYLDRLKREQHEERGVVVGKMARDRSTWSGQGWVPDVAARR